MSEEQTSEPQMNWRFLWEMKVAAQAVSEVYVSLGLLGGHYVKVAPKDFLDAVNDMQAVSDTHPHPRRFQFTMEHDVLWVHTAMSSKLQKRANENVVTRQSADSDPKAS
ncbi:hypothetical protein AB3G45_28140 [Shinella sp. S4-D37]|uniref:hypothetical protein n=1 Tax=Shinella sp. S4-D37 TaxID=3161999 RepID=UPI00346566A2